jgi:hypothetical protein
MATEAQIQANRANAQKSTGPRTAEGKTAVSQNAVKHGLSGRLDVIKGEDQAEFGRHRERLLAELRPAGAVESMLAERVVSLSWRLQRVERMHNEVFEVLLAKESTLLARLARSTIPGKAAEDDGLDLGRAVISDFANGRVLDRLLMYERRMENSLLKTLNDLHLRRLRVRQYISRHMDETGSEPAGSGPAWAERSRAPEEVGRGGPTSDQVGGRFYEETPDGVTTNAPNESSVEEQACETKPIHPEENDAQIPWNEEVRGNSWQGDSRETNPVYEGGFESDTCLATKRQ